MGSFFALSKNGVNILGAPVLNYLQQRNISVSASLLGKRNIRKFFLGNKRGTKLFKRDQAKGKYSYAPMYSEVKDVGFKYDDVFHLVPEMIPELVVPDLTDCPLKPYVSYKAADIYQTEFSPDDLFEVAYKGKMVRDFNNNKLDETGNPLEPSEMEKMTPEEAWTLARKTGSDIFSERTPRLWECLEKSLIDEEPPQMALTSDDLTHPSEKKKKEQELLSSTSTN